MCHLSKLTQLLMLALIVALVACSSPATPAPLPTPTRVYSQLPQPMRAVSAKFDVGGHLLYLECYGEGSPTVILENGLGMNMTTWYRIIPNITVATRVCA